MGAELVVVGAGPAGLCAALAAADAGVRVTLVDGNSAVGGQYYRQPTTGAGTLPARLARANTHPRISPMLGAPVWRVHDHVVHMTGGGAVSAAALVLATGATEVSFPFPGWELPGVVTAGAAQALLKGQDLLIGNRVVVAGSGPFLLPVAAGLARAGARVAGLFEATRALISARAAPAAVRHPGKVLEAAGYLKALVRQGIRPRPGFAVTACEGTDRVERAVVSRVDEQWRRIPGSDRRIDVDAVCVSYGFAPALELPRALGCRESGGVVWHDDNQATDVPGVFVAGETTGIGGVRLAEAEGQVAGLAAAAYLGRPIDRSGAAARTVIARERAFAALLGRLYPRRAGWLDGLGPETVFCRCEETTWADVQAALAAGAVDVRAVKALSRCGMGYCQGRMCGPPLVTAVSARLGRAPDQVGDLDQRLIAHPTPLADLAAE